MSGDFQIGEWRVQPAVNRMQRGDAAVRLEPKVMHVLVCLAQAAGEVVTREELIARVWPDVFVTDDVLHRAIRELRRVFGDTSSAPSYIETIRKRGYRLMVPAADPASPDSSAAPAHTPAVAPLAGGHNASRPWSFSLVAAAITLACAGAVMVLASRESDLVPEARARFVPVVSGPLNESDPALSPDGRRIAFVQRESGAAASADIFLRDLASGRETRLTANPASDRMPAWSPDGARIAFVRSTSSTCDVFVITVASGEERRVSACGNAHEPRLAWTPEGAGLLAAHRDGPQSVSRIVHVPLATGIPSPITTPPSGVLGDDSPAVSPDGRSMAFIRRVSGGVADVFVTTLAGGAVRRVTFDESDLTGIDWADDGRSIVYSSDRAGGYSLWRVSTDGGSPVLLAGGAARMKHPVATREGRRVVYENWQYEINLWEVGGTGAARARPITRSSELWNLYPQVAPDGSQIAYVSTQSGSHELWIANRDGSDARQMTHLGRGVVKTPKWSPDGQRVVYLARGDGGVNVQVLDVDTGIARTLTTTRTTKIAPTWSLDGRRVLFGAPDDDHQWAVWSVEGLGTPGPPRLELRDAVAAQPAGEWMYFSRPLTRGLWRVRAGNADAPEMVADAVAAGETASWQVQDAALYYTSPEGDLVTLRRLPLSGGADAVMAQLPQLSWPGFSVTPDGTVLYARWDRRESNLMSVEY